MGRIYLSNANAGIDKSANYARARTELGKSYKLAPSSAPVLFHYAKAHADQPDYPGENALIAAETSYDLVKDSDYAIYLAELYARRGLYDDMKETLSFFEQSPKNTRGAVATKQILDAVNAHKPKDEIVTLFAGYTDNPFLPYKK